MFERLSTFVGPLDLDMTAAVGSGSVDPSSRTLADVLGVARASLLTPERDGMEKRYRLLEPLRSTGLRAFVGAPQRKRRGASMPTTHLELTVQAGAALGTPASRRGWTGSR